MVQPRHLIPALAIIAISACKGKTEGSADSVGAASSTPAADSTAASSTSTTSSTGMTDSNILAKEHGGDSAEVVIGQYASTHASDAAVKSYARLLVSDHGKGQKEVASLAKKLSITPQAPTDDTVALETSHTLLHLKALKGKDFDTAFVAHEIADHQSDIADANKAVAAAQNPEVKSLVQKSIPELQKHLDKAQALGKKLGVSST